MREDLRSRPQHSRGTIYACYPHPFYPTISITGHGCRLDCKHCNRQYLEQMLPCPFPDLLYKTCVKLAERGAKGVLLSGGCNEKGYVPYERFIDAIAAVKKETGLFLSAHTGLLPENLAAELGRAGVDLVDFDLVGSDETIKNVFGLEKKVEDFVEAMKILKKNVGEVVPHICIGLDGGKIKGEFRAVELAAEINPRLLVFLVLVPTSRTPFENINPPSPEDVGKIVKWAKEKLPETELALGCMRPKTVRRAEVEISAILNGVRRVVMPSRETLDWAQKNGFQMKRVDACCSVPLGVRW
ncbi:MAG: radical SAM protein [Candidatus Hadarchaeales archaeon]